MEKIAIVTPADGNVREMTELTHPIMREYADKCEADFIILDHEAPHLHYRILKCHELLDEYKKILIMDSDVLIRNDCPNLFRLVPDEMVGTALEDKGTRTADRRKRMKQAQEKYGDIGWTSGYPNTGVMMVSNQHKEIFKERDLYMDWGYDCIYLGYWTKALGFDFYELPYQFNHMRCFSEPWNGSPDKYDSYIIHYAGYTGEERNQIIRQDFKKWKFQNHL